MSGSLVDQEWIDYYDGAFLEDAHQLISWGYEDARSRIDCNREEEEITGFIVDAIKDRLSDPLTPERFDKYHVDDTPPVSGGQATGKRRKKLDIVVESSVVKPRPEFVCESKRLRKNSFPIGEYVGKDGLLCFVNGDYASEQSVAAMMAYIQSDGVAYWFGELERRFDSDSTGELKITRGLQPETVIDTLVDEWASEHSRHKVAGIRIFHIFLDCC